MAAATVDKRLLGLKATDTVHSAARNATNISRLENRVFLGDNLPAMVDMRCKYGACVDLIYLDPPFNSGRDYFGMNGVGFGDTWPRNKAAEAEFQLAISHCAGSPRVIEFMHGMKMALERSHSGMLAYLVYMVPRLVAMWNAMKPTASIYLHCDPSANHYLRGAMDAVFGRQNFRDEIVWKRAAAKNNTTRKFGRLHDTIFFYTKSSEATFHPEYTSHDPKQIKKDKNTGCQFVTADLTMRCFPQTKNPRKFKWSGRSPSANRQWRFDEKTLNRMKKKGSIYQSSPKAMPVEKRFMDGLKGVKIHAWWDDIKALTARHKEKKLDYPTQKPVALLKRIILASSNPGDLVLDPFCGSGPTIAACHETGRKFIGMDISPDAADFSARRMREYYPDFGELRVVRPVEAKPKGKPKSPQPNHGGDKTLTGVRKWEKAA